MPPDEPEIGIEFDYGAADEYEEFEPQGPVRAAAVVESRGSSLTTT